MASLTKKYTKKKLLGQVYTPLFIVEKILHDIGFNDKSVLGKSILDPSCGDGRFLTVIAQKIIAHSPPEQLKENLEKIYGWDIDAEAVEACLTNLNEIVKDLGIAVDWRIEVCNSLEKIITCEDRFDFIVGNPPYIRIQHLVEEERRFIQGLYKFCKKGSTDMYVAFYELCRELLAGKGVCALITPNTFFYTETAQAMRAYFERHQTIQRITNYGDIQLFDNATTYSAIMQFGKTEQSQFLFETALTAQTFSSRLIDIQELAGRKVWQLSTQKTVQIQGRKLKDICKIQVGLTTLADKIFILKSNNTETGFFESRLVGKLQIEPAILKPIIKASKIKNSQDAITEYIIFPYQKINGKHCIIPELTLQKDFPLAYAYLLSQKDALIARDNGKPNSVAWYAFGRSQGLDTSFGKKILFSPMNNNPNFVLYEREDCTFYSGYCIKYEGDYNFLLKQLNSERLANFVAISARDFRGGWKAYNKKILDEFEIEA